MANVGYIRSLEDLYTFSVTGTVMSNDTWSETRVSGGSSGGGGYIGPHGGHVSAPSVSVTSTTSEKTRFFIDRENSNKEYEVKLTNSDFSVRPGHRVTILIVGDQKSQAGHVMAAYNHKTTTRSVFESRIEWIISASNKVGGCLFLFVAWAFALILGGYVLAQDEQCGWGCGDDVDMFTPSALMILAALLVIWPLVTIIRRSNRRGRFVSDVRQQINERLDAAVAKARDNPPASASLAPSTE